MGNLNLKPLLIFIRHRSAFFFRRVFPSPGKCKFGTKCRYAHGEDELREKIINTPTDPTNSDQVHAKEDKEMPLNPDTKCLSNPVYKNCEPKAEDSKEEKTTGTPGIKIMNDTETNTHTSMPTLLYEEKKEVNLKKDNISGVRPHILEPIRKLNTLEAIMLQEGIKLKNGLQKATSVNFQNIYNTGLMMAPSAPTRSQFYQNICQTPTDCDEQHEDLLNSAQFPNFYDMVTGEK